MKKKKCKEDKHLIFLQHKISDGFLNTAFTDKRNALTTPNTKIQERIM